MTTQELNDFVRFFLGGIDNCVISDDDLNNIIDMVLSSGMAENDCQEKYYSVLETLRWLDRRSKTSTGEVSGPIKKRSEKVGQVAITEEYSDLETKKDSYDELISELMDNPSLIGCNPFPDDNSNLPSGNVILGGSDVNGYSESYETRNRAQQSAYEYKTNSLFPWRPGSGTKRRGY